MTIAQVMAEHSAATSSAGTQAKQGLRAARRAFSRAHICAAARQLFAENGYAATTMEQIGKVAGAPRSTLYTHFRDKEEILDTIADDYIAKLEQVVLHAPGPAPTRAEIDIWIDELAAFISEERLPTILFNGFGTGMDVPRAVKRIGECVMAALASRLPAFQLALTGGDEQLAAKAYAQVVVRELSLCCQTYALMGGGPIGASYLKVATDILHRFLIDFSGTPIASA